MKKFLMLCVCSCLLPAHAAPSGWARIQPSIDYAAHDRWQKSLPRAVSDIPSAASAVRGQDVFLYLRLDSYGRDRQNRTSVTYDLRIVSPLALRVTNPVLYNAAYWSLKTEVRQSGLFGVYCRYARGHENLSAQVKRDLDAIMADDGS